MWSRRSSRRWRRPWRSLMLPMRVLVAAERRANHTGRWSIWSVKRMVGRHGSMHRGCTSPGQPTVEDNRVVCYSRRSGLRRRRSGIEGMVGFDLKSGNYVSVA